MNSFTQNDYRVLVSALDDALEVFTATTTSEEDAQAALKDFVLNHYFKVWRAMAPPS